MRTSYQKHLLAAQQGKIPLNGGTTPHLAGLYGALSTRYMAAGIPKQEPFLWSELSPFLLMSEADSIEALAEYIVCQEHPKEGKEPWLQKLINDALRTLPSTNDDWKAMATMALIQPTIYWRNLLDQGVKDILQNEFLKILPSRDKIAPEIYNLLDEELRKKIDNLKS